MRRLLAFLRHLVARERLPRETAPAPPRRRGFLRTLVGREALPHTTVAPPPKGARSMEHAKHVFRVLIALVALIATYILVRGSFVPKTYGQYGPYRYQNVLEQRDKPLVHGALDSCKGCHKPVADKHDKAKHATVPCEDCHAPLSTHVADGKRIAAMAKDPSYLLCVRCHRKLPGRSTVIKQVVPQEHVTKQGEKLAGNVCIGCHDAHSPQMGDDGDKGEKAKGGKP